MLKHVCEKTNELKSIAHTYTHTHTHTHTHSNNNNNKTANISNDGSGEYFTPTSRIISAKKKTKNKNNNKQQITTKHTYIFTQKQITLLRRHGSISQLQQHSKIGEQTDALGSALRQCTDVETQRC